MPGAAGEVVEFLDPGSFGALEDFSRDRPAIATKTLRYAPFLPDPEKIMCVGVNYHNRNEEYRDGSEAPKYPSLFMRSPSSFTGHDAPLVRPKESEQLDYEGEIVIVVGKGGRRIPREDALSHIAGLTLMNEGTVRDWVRHAKFNVTQGKNFDRSGAIGPWMVTADELAGFDNLSLQTRVNGELRQDDETSNMIFGLQELIEYISSFTTLKVGDLISTGTPTGAGARFDPPRYLKPGDVVEITSPTIGTLRNGVIDG
jgi:2-keto-4-pentenoate hydratase/2-oxohepta-3-ene-1,7-dioic acid hydratase in catechol pathway